MNLYQYLCAISVILHVSVSYPSPEHPQGYGMAACSGVFISDNEILTAAHCVEESRGHQWIQDNEGDSFSVSVKRKDKIKDLAILKVTKKGFKHTFAVLGSPIKITDTVYTVNNGDDYAKTWNTGIVNNIVFDEGVLSILHNALIMPGASGSGLFNEKGQLIGVNVATIHYFSEAVDYYEIEAFLNKR